MDRDLVSPEGDPVDEAVEVVTGLRDAVAACPGREVEGDSTQVITSLPGDTGYDTVTFAVTYAEGLGGGVYPFTRVGRAVLATYDGGGWGPDSIAAGAARATERTGRITPAMCAFTGAAASAEMTHRRRDQVPAPVWRTSWFRGLAGCPA